MKKFCGCCNGKGRLYSNGRLVFCPVCDGKGYKVVAGRTDGFTSCEYNHKNYDSSYEE